ncbi:MAG: IS1380 family transposase, partial [Candidatus Brocadia sp. AMX1]|nr:IS1380 family transposase [Candidatus Brocadia sp. AMX1]
MKTGCKDAIEYQGLSGRKVISQFNGGQITTDAGGLLLRELEQARGFMKEFSKCFTDYRDQGAIEHTVEELLSQRIYGIALGYEDLNDHDQLRIDPLLAVLCKKKDPTGQDRRSKIVLDLDATDDPIHGSQEGRFFHGYYGEYCYLPLYIFCDDYLLCAKLRTSGVDASEGAKEEIERVVNHVRNQWPEVKIVVRGDSGSAREEIMSWCEANHVDYLFGLARNSRLQEEIQGEMEEARKQYEQTGRASRVYKDFFYKTV